MRRPLPDCVKRSDTADGWKYTFPWREVPLPVRAKLQGYLVTAVVTGVVGLGLVLWADGVADMPSRVFMRALAAFAGLGTVVLVGLRAVYTWTRSEIEIGLDSVTMIERQGPFCRARRRTWDHVARIVTHHLVHYPHQRFEEPTTIGTLEIVGKGAQTLWFAHDYPRDWLLALADELAWVGRVEHCESPWAAEPTSTGRAFFAHECNDDDTFDRETPPDGSNCVVEQDDKQWRLTIPLISWRQRLMSWSGTARFVVLAIGIFVLAFVYAQNGLHWLAEVGPVALFIGFAILVTVAHLFRGIRGATLHLDDEFLTITESYWVFSERVQTVAREEIVASRLETHEEDSRESHGAHLRIVRANGQAVTGLTGRDVEELRWIATELRRALGVPAAAPRSVSV